MSVEIAHLPLGRRRDANRVLVEAFMPDPVFSYFFPDPALRARVFGLLFADLIAANQRFGGVWAAMDQERVAGAAIWITPSARESLWDRLRTAWVQAKLRTLTPVARDLMAGFAALGPLHPTGPHWYLAFVGIDPVCQGDGLGRRLLAPAIAQADAQGLLCYLETPFPRTHPFYRSLGFELLEELRPFRGAPPIWRFLRKAKPRP